MAVSKPRVLAVLALLLLIPSLALQILVSLGLPFIKQIFFLQVDIASGQSIHFGLWSNCLRPNPTSLFTCAPTGLGYKQTLFRDLVVSAFPVGLPVALVVQPIATGFTGLALLGATAATLGAGRSFAWPFLASLGAAAAAAALVVELVMFIQARNNFRSPGFSVLGSAVQGTSFGPALWIQVAGVAAAILAALFLIVSFALRKRSNRSLRDDAAFYDFEPTRQPAPVSDMVYYPEDESKKYGNMQPQQYQQSRQYQPGSHEQYQIPPMQHQQHEMDGPEEGGVAYALTTDEAQLSPYGAVEGGGVDNGADYDSQSQYDHEEHDRHSSAEVGDTYGSAIDGRRPSHSSRTPLTYEPRSRRYSERGAF